jgi:hypothetical protein
MAGRSLLEGTTVYLSGPMDFVRDRRDEATNGWRARITSVLEKEFGVRVFDPWFKPLVRGRDRYGIEDADSTGDRDHWVFGDSEDAARIRSRLSGRFWEVMHIDLRMVDLSDFVIAYCPTNLYSVGTPHEIVLARQQHKPVLLVSPPVRFDAWHKLRAETSSNPRLKALFEAAEVEVVARENPTGAPSQWYMTLVGSESFFDGFGWDDVRDRYEWPRNYLDDREQGEPGAARPLLPFLKAATTDNVPRRWDGRLGDRGAYRRNDDWLVLERTAEDAHDQQGRSPNP